MRYVKVKNGNLVIMNLPNKNLASFVTADVASVILACCVAVKIRFIDRVSGKDPRMYRHIINFTRLGIVGLILAFLVACGHTPVSSMVKLRNFDPTTTDVEKLSIAVAVPNQFKVSDNGVTMLLEIRKKDGSQSKRETFALTSSLQSDDQQKLRRLSVPEGRKILAYRIHPQDVERFNTIRRFSIEKKKTKQWDGSFGVGTQVCRINDVLPESILITTYIKSSETKEYVPFIVDLDLAKQTDVGRVETWAPLCDPKT
jgi:hypothetical protein